MSGQTYTIRMSWDSKRNSEEGHCNQCCQSKLCNMPPALKNVLLEPVHHRSIIRFKKIGNDGCFTRIRNDVSSNLQDVIIWDDTGGLAFNRRKVHAIPAHATSL
eukprot:4592694-Amphidinium_carterae.1